MVNVEMVGKRRTSSLLITIHNGVYNDRFKMLTHNAQTRHNDGKKIELIRPRCKEIQYIYGYHPLE